MKMQSEVRRLRPEFGDTQYVVQVFSDALELTGGNAFEERRGAEEWAFNQIYTARPAWADDITIQETSNEKVVVEIPDGPRVVIFCPEGDA